MAIWSTPGVTGIIAKLAGSLLCTLTCAVDVAARRDFLPSAFTN